MQKTHELYVKDVVQINPNIEVIEQYINSKTKILHRCKIDGHEWKQRPDKILGGRKCPLCSGYLISPTYGNLEIVYPDIALEWDYEKNGSLLPTMVSYGSDKEVWWVCKQGHSYKRRISDRTISGRHCSKCTKIKHSSIVELELYFYIKKYFSDAVLGYKDKENGLTEIDVYIPSLKIGFEYDGYYWHQNIQRDLYKDEICKKLDIKLVRIREPGCPQYNSTCCFIYLKDFSRKTLEVFIKYILEALGITNPIVCINEDIENINSLISIQCERYIKRKYTNKEENYMYSHKMVYCHETHLLFISINNAEKETGIHSSRICSCCRGKLKSAGKHLITGEKLHWYYVEDKHDKYGIIKGAISLNYITREEVDIFIKNAK